MNEAEIKSFVAEGRLRLTNLNNAIRALNDWGASFTMRGGADVFGNDAALIAGISNVVQASITDADRATVARLRTDV
jgi:hypothetical protein